MRTARGFALPALAVLFGLGSGCATVKSSYLRPDYDQMDRNRVKRLTVVILPLPDSSQKVGELWGLLVRRYVNQKRDFIVKQNVALATSTLNVRDHCVGGIEGVLWVRPHPPIKRVANGMEVAAVGQLLRCPDGQGIWGAEAGGSWSNRDDHLKEVTAEYVGELGPEVEPYVAPSFNLLRPLLDTLPEPILSERDKDEKIELGE